MTDFLFLMWKPFLACLILTGIHAYLGIHVIERQVIFVDLALAQIAALGATVGFLFGMNFHEAGNYWFSLAATFIGAVVFALSRSKREKIPQEAIIGIVYAVSAAAAVMILSQSAGGDEEIRHMLVGNILLVELSEIIKIFILYGLVGLIHFRFRKQFLMISTQPALAYSSGMNVKLWDLLFYITFGVVVTSSVRTAGVLLVFSLLIVPAVSAMLFFKQISHRLMAGWGIGVVASLAGIIFSYFYDFPTGATIVCSFGFILVMLVILRRSRRI